MLQNERDFRLQNGKGRLQIIVVSARIFHLALVFSQLPAEPVSSMWKLAIHRGKPARTTPK